MIYYKTEEEIKLLKQGGQILAKILNKLCSDLKPGRATEDLEELALKLIKDSGGRPAFKGYDLGGGLKFPSALCVSINNEVVHGSSYPNRIIQEGDLVTIDIGMEWPLQKKSEAQAQGRAFNIHSPGGGFYTDTCKTVLVGQGRALDRKLLEVTNKALKIGINKARAGISLAQLGQAIEAYVLKNGFSVVKDLVGHGVGYFAHEDPYVFNYQIPENDPENIILKPGMVIAIEPMVNLGRSEVKLAKNNFTILTADNSNSAHFEHSIAILEEGNLILTA